MRIDQVESIIEINIEYIISTLKIFKIDDIQDFVRFLRYPVIRMEVIMSYEAPRIVQDSKYKDTADWIRWSETHCRSPKLKRMRHQ